MFLSRFLLLSLSTYDTGNVTLGKISASFVMYYYSWTKSALSSISIEYILTLKAPITTAAGNIYKNLFTVFQRK